MRLYTLKEKDNITQIEFQLFCEYDKILLLDLLIQNSPGPVSNTFVFIINKEMWKDLQEILQKYWGKYECEKNTYSVIGNNFIFKLKE